MDAIRSKLAAGGSIFGTWSAIGNTICAELLAGAGYDFLIVDTQHGGVSAGDLLPMLQAIEAKGVPALVRVTWADQAQIMRAMDLGAAGVVVPMVSTAEQAKLAAEAIRYPPHGIRSFGPVRSYYAQDGTPADPICLVMVETAEAMENLDAIVATPGVDGILVGPMDLGLSFGFDVATAFSLPEKTHAAIDQVVAACRKHNKISASAAFSLPHAKRLKEQGVQMISGGADSLLIRAGAAADLKEIRSW